MSRRDSFHPDGKYPYGIKPRRPELFPNAKAPQPDKKPLGRPHDQEVKP